MAPAQVHATAVVDPGARLADDVCIGPYAVVEGDVEIAAGVRIGPHAVVCRYATVGPGCEIHMGAVVGHQPQDLTFEPCESGCRLGAGTVVREYATLHRGTKPGTETVVGERCYLMGASHVAHNCRLGNDVILAHGALLGGYVEVGDRAFVGGNVAIHQFCRVGRLAMLSGHLALSMDCPPFHIAAGRNVIRGLNVVGMKRANLSAEARQAVKAAHRLLFRSGLPLAQAARRVETEIGQAEANELARFCVESKRGVCRPRKID